MVRRTRLAERAGVRTKTVFMGSSFQNPRSALLADRLSIVRPGETILMQIILVCK